MTDFQTACLVITFIAVLLYLVWQDRTGAYRGEASSPYPPQESSALWTYNEYYTKDADPTSQTYTVKVNDNLLVVSKSTLELFEVWNLLKMAHGTVLRVKNSEGKKERILSHPEDILALKPDQTLELYTVE
jgi:hypothetical protein